jgi:hypothetical protein
MGFQNKTWYARDKKPSSITDAVDNRLSTYNKRLINIENEMFPVKIIDGQQVQSFTSTLTELKAQVSDINIKLGNTQNTNSNQNKIDVLMENAENVNNTINLMNNDIRQLLELVSFILSNDSAEWNNYAGQLGFDNVPSVQYQLNPVLSTDNKNTNFPLSFTRPSTTLTK